MAFPRLFHLMQNLVGKRETAASSFQGLGPVRGELELLVPFCRREGIGALRPYTEEDIQAAEQRLGFVLPDPVRDLYLVMGDYMCQPGYYYFRALELLRWDGDCLLLMHDDTDGYGFGIQRNRLNVHTWKTKDCCPEEKIFEQCRRQGDFSGMERAAAAYFAFWNGGQGRSEVQKDTIKQGGSFRFTTELDAWVLHFVMANLYGKEKNASDEAGFCYWSAPLPREPEQLREVHRGIVRWFSPLSARPELLEVPNVQKTYNYTAAYISPEKDCLLLMPFAFMNRYLLLPQRAVPRNFVKELEQKTGLSFLPHREVDYLKR